MVYTFLQDSDNGKREFRVLHIQCSVLKQILTTKILAKLYFYTAVICFFQINCFVYRTSRNTVQLVYSNFLVCKHVAANTPTLAKFYAFRGLLVSLFDY